MEFDLVVANGLVVLEDGVAKVDVGIADGKIAALFNGAKHESGRTIPADGRYVFPGAIDTHTHFFEPGAEYREDFAHGSRAAASGGFTCVMEMANSDPAVVDRETFDLKKKLAAKGSVVDYALWGGATAANLHQVPELCALGCAGFKAFTLDAGPAFPYLDTEMQMRAMRAIAPTGRVLGLHAEDPAIIEARRKLYSGQKWTLELHEQARPYYAELAAINQVVLLSAETGCPVHICHLSIPEGAELIARAKADGVNITAESCAHYFLLDVESCGGFGAYALIQPPIRTRERAEGLWKYLLDGTIDYLGTDHAPYVEADKEPPHGDGWRVPGGAPCIDVAFPLMFDAAVSRKGMDPAHFAKVSATNAAKRFGLYPRKGAIRVGADADLALIHPARPFVVDRARSFSKTHTTKFPYQGRSAACTVETTIVRGKVVYEDGRITAEDGYGRFVAPGGRE